VKETFYKASIHFKGKLPRQRKMQHNMIEIGSFNVDSLNLDDVKAKALEAAKRDIKAFSGTVSLVLNYMTSEHGITSWEMFGKKNLRLDLTSEVSSGK
jgi:hypothetical protein